MCRLFKFVIFDCDGTLVDSQHSIVAAMHKAYAAHGLPTPERAQLLSIVGLSLHEAFHVLSNGQADFPIESLVADYKAAFFAMRKSGTHFDPLFPGARDVITALSRRSDVLLGIATGKSRRGLEAVLSQHGLRDNFHVIKTADDAPSKPHPAMVIDAMNEAGVTPRDTIVVGDTVFDMKMAHAAGAAGIGVGWGYHQPSALLQAGATTVLNDFPSLMPTLEQIWRR
jgi:phosphoglycolate phosphatase